MSFYIYNNMIDINLNIHNNCLSFHYLYFLRKGVHHPLLLCVFYIVDPHISFSHFQDYINTSGFRVSFSRAGERMSSIIQEGRMNWTNMDSKKETGYNMCE